KPNRLALWRTSDLKPVAMPEVSTRFFELTAGAGHVLASADTEVEALDASGRVIAKTALSSPSGASLAAGRVALTGSTGDIALHEYPSLQPIRSWNAGQFQTVVRLRPDAQLLASIGGRVVRLWDPDRGRLVAELEL